VSSKSVPTVQIIITFVRRSIIPMSRQVTKYWQFARTGNSPTKLAIFYNWFTVHS